MSRELKFRAWDKERKRMLPFAFISTVRGAEPETLDDAIDIAEQSQVLMQYTGLKDRNGVEIYEGDIVKGGIDVEVVEFIDGGFQPLIDDGFMFHAENRLEIIGNIYENPELLGVKSET